MSGGVFFGAAMPTHWVASRPGTTSATVGTSGSNSERTVPVTASGRKPPARICSMVSNTVPMTPCTCPLSASVIAGGPPR